MKEKIQIGIIGVGNRGDHMIKNIFGDMQDVDIAALCDVSEERIAKMKQTLEEKKHTNIFAATDYRDVIAREDIDAIVIFTGWVMHTEIAIAAMEAGKYVGMEVGGAYDVSDCLRLVHTFEKTGSHCMMLENCCYGRREMMALRMAREGLFGEIVHCTGAYMHDLRTTDLSKPNSNTYRIREYSARNGENYPTHALGPICKVLNINRGNRLLYLSSMASKACGLRDYWKRTQPADDPVQSIEIKQGDVVVTNIMCANGETIMLRLDTTLPRAYYSRDISVRGTRGLYEEARRTVFFDGMEEETWENEDHFFEKYDHPLHAEYVRKGEKEGHGGMDWLVGRAFVESVKRGIPTPIDTYDTATWMMITPLSEQSAALGGAPVAIPDLTRGKWLRPKAPLDTKYSLDIVVDDPDTPIY